MQRMECYSTENLRLLADHAGFCTASMDYTHKKALEIKKAVIPRNSMSRNQGAPNPARLKLIEL
jgi:hypothetical protein